MVAAPVSATTLRFGTGFGLGFGWLRGRAVGTWRTAPADRAGRGPFHSLREAVDAGVDGCIELLDGRGRGRVEALPQLMEAVVDGRGL